MTLYRFGQVLFRFRLGFHEKKQYLCIRKQSSNIHQSTLNRKFLTLWKQRNQLKHYSSSQLA